MKQKYYVDNLISGFIKCLLWDTYLPTVSIWKPGKAIIKGLTYITFDHNIVVAQLDFTPKKYLGEFTELPEIDPTIDYTNCYITLISADSVLYKIIKNNSWINASKLDIEGPQTSLSVNSEGDAFFKRYDDYIAGKFYRGISSNYMSNSALYDAKTHYYLGSYLRTYRDLYGINLMPYYNCYSGDVSTNIRINQNERRDSTTQALIAKSDELVFDNTVDDGLMTYIVPIKFNQPYTIYLNSSVPFLVKPAYYDGISLSPFKDVRGIEVQSTIVRSCSTTHPFVYQPLDYAGNIEAGDTDAKLKEEYLVLLVQVSKSISSSFTVLEGNYSKQTLDYNAPTVKLPDQILGDVSALSTEVLDEILSPLSSLPYNVDGKNYAFNNRLIEYLLYAPIVINDRIKDNIKRIQETITSDKFKSIFKTSFKGEYKKDIWNNELRYYLYNIATQNSSQPLRYDINGYVDKDSEFIIDKGRESRGDFDV